LQHSLTKVYKSLISLIVWHRPTNQNFTQIDCNSEVGPLVYIVSYFLKWACQNSMHWATNFLQFYFALKNSNQIIYKSMWNVDLQIRNQNWFFLCINWLKVTCKMFHFSKNENLLFYLHFPFFLQICFGDQNFYFKRSIDMSDPGNSFKSMLLENRWNTSKK